MAQAASGDSRAASGTAGRQDAAEALTLLGRRAEAVLALQVGEEAPTRTASPPRCSALSLGLVQAATHTPPN